MRRGDGARGREAGVGLTPWPPTAGAEAATRPASLRWKAGRAAWQQTQGKRRAVVEGGRGDGDILRTLAHIY